MRLKFRCALLDHDAKMTERDSRTVVDIASLKVSCANCPLYQLCLPFGLGRNETDQLDTIVHHRRPIPRGASIFLVGDAFHALYAIRSGSVKTYTITIDGGEQITGFHLPGQVIGLDAISRTHHPCGAEALETASVCEIPYSRLEELAARIPGLGRQLMRIMSSEIHSQEDLLTLLGKRSAEERLAALLLSLSLRLQQRGLSAREFNLSMSRNDIGNYLGLAVETVSRLFTRFQQQRLISVRYKYIRLEDLAGLRTLAGMTCSCDSPRARL